MYHLSVTTDWTSPQASAGGITASALNDQAVQQAAAMAAAQRNNQLISTSGGGLAAGYNRAVQDQQRGQQAQIMYVQSQSATGPAYANLANAQATQATAQGQATYSQVPVNAEVAAQKAADLYKSVQGGGVSAQIYTALPYLIGGTVALGLIAWILYSSKRKRRS